MKLFLYNTLSRKKEEFKSINKDMVGLYRCGPTVYDFAHIGNLRSYLFSDLLKRVLIYNNYKVFDIINITDVGHLTGDMDMGDDKVEKKAKLEKKSAWEIADYFTKSFKEDISSLNILEPSLYCKVTDYIDEQIELIKILEAKGYTYQISDGIYFDSSKVKDYNKLSKIALDKLKEGARVEKNEEKRNPTDFALWKFSPKNTKRQMEWNSPWGIGFPGWHIECSAISLKYLNDKLDIHVGGIDHINVHHSNEIAQSEAATGKKFFNFWLHNSFLNILGGKKMAKSDNNFLTLKSAVIDLGFNPLAYRLASLQVHYRKTMEYSEMSMKNSQEALDSLYKQVELIKKEVKNNEGSINQDYKSKFIKAVNDDLNSPQALAILFKLIKDKNILASDKYKTILDFDTVLGLKLNEADKYIKENLKVENLSDEIKTIISERQKARVNKDFSHADKLRDKLSKMGYIIEDKPDNQFTIKEK